MLDSTFKERVRELVHIRFEECRERARAELAQMSADLALRGFLHHSHGAMICHAIALKQIDERVDVAWDAIRRVLSSQAIAYTDGLAHELKEILEFYIPASLWELPALYTSMSQHLTEPLRYDLLDRRDRAIKRATAEVNLFVDGLRAQARPTAQSETKELDQKFRILYSPAQAALDFEEWKSQLNGAHIGILFLDIDNFKSLNTRHTETRVDQTILPEAMRLLTRLVNKRGSCYRQGGDEFVVILPNHDHSESLAFAEKLRAAFERYDFKVEGVAEKLTVSIGMASWPQHGSSYEEVLQRANEGKRIAKIPRNAVREAVVQLRQVLVLLAINEPTISEVLRGWIQQAMGDDGEVIFAEVSTAEEVEKRAKTEPFDMFILLLNNLRFESGRHDLDARIEGAASLVLSLHQKYGKLIIALTGHEGFTVPADAESKIVLLSLPFDGQTLVNAVKRGLSS